MYMHMYMYIGYLCDNMANILKLVIIAFEACNHSFLSRNEMPTSSYVSLYNVYKVSISIMYLLVEMEDQFTS